MVNQTPYCSPEIWGGIECTINRVRQQYFDQLHYAGHYNRASDIDTIINTGIKKIRYPVLWEKHQPEKDTVIDWTWTEERLDAFRARGVDVIAGLVHHGSGPAYTHLLDPSFPELLAGYAAKVAEQFPWIEYYTPVNEPLTTARFSGLYGIWYPHARDAESCIRMLLNQIKGVVLSMQAIRKINPDAKLVQTEDLGKVYSTPKLHYQAKYENERRWLTYDLLCGKVKKGHLLWKHLMLLGISETELNFFQENICIPEVFGFNYYVTSERYLDEKLHLYPTHTHGGNQRHRYADVEAVRVELEEPNGLEVLLTEAWDRYQQPLAITEAHLHCHREDQLRWFRHIWTTCSNLVSKGVAIKAVTSWAMLGSYGWNKLLSQPGGDYEPGAFDLRGGQPRPTAVARFITEVAKSSRCDHHLAGKEGWWERPTRFFNGSMQSDIRTIGAQADRPILIIGRRGTLGQAFAKVCHDRNLPFRLVGRDECEISDLKSVENVIDHYKPWAIINAAGYVRVDDAENDREKCFRDNTLGPQNLAIAAASKGIRLIAFSSDLVFDGKKSGPYVESDPAGPLSVYGQSKHQCEVLVQKHSPDALIIRTSAFFGPWDEYNFIYYVRKSLSQFESIKVANDLIISPTYVPDLVHASLDLLVDEENGIWHLANKGALTWADLAYEIADQYGLNKRLIEPASRFEMGFLADRPANSVLGSERACILPKLEDALFRYREEEKLLEKARLASYRA
jgi:dTDP-4-dehydrorhamnose reductase